MIIKVNKKQQNIDAIAEQWVNLVLAHVRAKKLSKSIFQRTKRSETNDLSK